MAGVGAAAPASTPVVRLSFSLCMRRAPAQCLHTDNTSRRTTAQDQASPLISRHRSAPLVHAQGRVGRLGRHCRHAAQDSSDPALPLVSLPLQKPPGPAQARRHHLCVTAPFPTAVPPTATAEAFSRPQIPSSIFSVSSSPCKAQATITLPSESR